MLTLLPLLLKLLPTLIGFVETILQSAGDKRLLDAGRAEAIAAALAKAQAQIALARQAEADAAARQAKDPSDSAFDPEFQRKN
jgi:hypothetical protein